MAGHGDIDLLCRNAYETVEAIKAMPCNPELGRMGDNTHFYIMYCGQKVSIDVRSLGDGYFCEPWEAAMLKNRVRHECFYIMDEENRLYSLIYHAIFQKPSLSEEYLGRLLSMTGNKQLSEYQLIELLEQFMRRHGYNYVYANDYYVPLRRCMHDKSLCHFTLAERWPHFKFELWVGIIALLVEIKHIILGKSK